MPSYAGLCQEHNNGLISDIQGAIDQAGHIGHRNELAGLAVSIPAFWSMSLASARRGPLRPSGMDGEGRQSVAVFIPELATVEGPRAIEIRLRHY